MKKFVNVILNGLGVILFFIAFALFMYGIVMSFKRNNNSSLKSDEKKIDSLATALGVEQKKSFELEAQMAVIEAYQKGFEAAHNSIQGQQAYDRGYDQASVFYKAELEFCREEIKRIRKDYEDLLISDNIEVSLKPIESEEVGKIYEETNPSNSYPVFDLEPSLETKVNVYPSCEVEDVNSRNLFFGFTSDLSVGLQDGDPVKIESWNYLGLNYRCGEDQNIGSARCRSCRRRR